MVQTITNDPIPSQTPHSWPATTTIAYSAKNDSFPKYVEELQILAGVLSVLGEDDSKTRKIILKRINTLIENHV